MISLYVVVEGPTEEAFVKRVLQPHLEQRHVFPRPIVVETGRADDGSKHSGGGLRWPRLRKDLHMLLRDRRDALRVTTMFDLYRLPTSFPGMEKHRNVENTVKRCGFLEEALKTDIADHRFLPYLQRHEFEALVLASVDHLDAVLDPQQRPGLRALRAEIAGQAPEDVNDGANTAPSRRLSKHLDGYRKALHGPLATERAGLSALRQSCPRFDAWVGTLETLAEAGDT